LILYVYICLLASRSLTSFVFHILFLFFLVNLSHFLVSFLRFALFSTFIFRFFFFRVHITIKIILHFYIIFFLFVCILILIFFFIFMPHNLLFKLYLISNVLSSIMSLSFSNTHSISNFLTSTLFVIFLLFFNTKTICLKINCYICEYITKFHEADNLFVQNYVRIRFYFALNFLQL